VPASPPASRRPPTAGLPPSSHRRTPICLPLHLAAHEGQGRAPLARREVGAGRGAARPNARQGRGGRHRPGRGRGGEGAAILGEVGAGRAPPTWARQGQGGRRRPGQGRGGEGAAGLGEAGAGRVPLAWARQRRGGHRRPGRGRGGWSTPARTRRRRRSWRIFLVPIFSKTWAAANFGRARSGVELGGEAVPPLGGGGGTLACSQGSGRVGG
jgi:hypothetical protein